MTYLHKLARRLSLLWDWSLPYLAVVLAVGCSKGEPRDFLSPTPGKPQTPVSLSVSPRLGTIQPGQTIQFSASGVSAQGNPLAVEVDWSATSGTISSSGLFTADRTGQSRVHARLRVQPSLVDSAWIAVYQTLGDVLELRLTPDSALIQEGEPIKLSAYAKLANGTTTQSLPLAWDATGGNVDGSGWFTATSEGSYVVTALAASGAKGNATVRVKNTPRTLLAVTVSPNSATLDAGGSTQFSVTGTWSDGSNAHPQVLWSSTGGTVTSDGLYTAGSTGGAFVVVARDKNGSLSDTAFVSVVEPGLIGVDVTPATVSLAPGASQQFSATARMSDGSTRSVGVQWSAAGGTISQAGLYTAPQTAGTYRVTASVTGTSFTDTASVSVAVPQATLTQVILNPSSASVPAGGTQQFTVTGLYSDGSTKTPSLSWSANGGSISAGGLFTAPAAQGTYRVIATNSGTGKADTSVVSVVAPVLVQLVLNPSSVALQPGQAQQFTVAGLKSDGSSVVPTVTWSATGGSVSGAGLYTAGTATGTFRLVALHSGGLADTSLVTISVPAPTLVRIDVAPTSVTVQPDGSQQFTVSGTMSDGGTSTPVVTWSASAGAVSSSGLYTAPAQAGSYRVVATQQGGSLKDTSVVTVSATAPTLTSLSISPQNATILPSASKQFTVAGVWSDGSTVTPTVDWSASGGTITNAGLYYAPTQPGTYQVTAREQNGSVSATTDVVVESPPVLVSLVVSPSTSQLAPGGSQQFSVVASYSNGGTGTPSLTWSATGGTVTSGGKFTAGSVAGTFRVVVASGSVKDTAAVVITSTAPTLVAVEVSPGSASVAAGATAQFSAVGRMSDGSTSPVTVAWSATGGTVSAGGLYTAGQTAGAFAVVGTGPSSLKDTAAVTVATATPPPPPTGGQPVGTLAHVTWGSYGGQVANLYPNGTIQHAGLGSPKLSFSSEQGAFPTGFQYAQTLGFIPDPHGQVGTMLQIKLKAGWNYTGSNPSGIVPYVGIPVGTNAVNYPKLWIRHVKRYEPGYTNSGLEGIAAAAQKVFMPEPMVGNLTTTFKGGEQGVGIGWEQGYQSAGTRVTGDRTTYAKSGSDPYWNSWFSTAHYGAFVEGPSYDGDAWRDGQLYEWIWVWWLEDNDRVLTVGQWWRRLTGSCVLNGVTKPAPCNFGNVQNAPSQQDGWNYAWNTYRHDTGTYSRIRTWFLQANRNRSIDKDMSWAWGPVTVVDGSVNRNPWGLPASVLPVPMR